VELRSLFLCDLVRIQSVLEGKLDDHSLFVPDENRNLTPSLVLANGTSQYRLVDKSLREMSR
jgi:hypothetical protein